MTDLTEKTTALDEQSAVENSEEITQTPSVWKEIFIQGVWKNNSTLVQLLGLCPLLAVSSTATKCIRFRFGDYVGFNLYKHRCFALS